MAFWARTGRDRDVEQKQDLDHPANGQLINKKGRCRLHGGASTGPKTKRRQGNHCEVKYQARPLYQRQTCRKKKASNDYKRALGSSKND